MRVPRRSSQAPVSKQLLQIPNVSAPLIEEQVGRTVPESMGGNDRHPSRPTGGGESPVERLIAEWPAVPTRKNQLAPRTFNGSPAQPHPFEALQKFRPFGQGIRQPGHERKSRYFPPCTFNRTAVTSPAPFRTSRSPVSCAHSWNRHAVKKSASARCAARGPESSRPSSRMVRSTRARSDASRKEVSTASGRTPTHPSQPITHAPSPTTTRESKFGKPGPCVHPAAIGVGWSLFQIAGAHRAGRQWPTHFRNGRRRRHPSPPPSPWHEVANALHPDRPTAPATTPRRRSGRFGPGVSNGVGFISLPFAAAILLVWNLVRRRRRIRDGRRPEQAIAPAREHPET